MTDYPGQGLPPPESGGPPPYGPPPGQPPYGQSPGPPGQPPYGPPPGPPGQPPPGQPPYGQPPPGPPGQPPYGQPPPGPPGQPPPGQPPFGPPPGPPGPGGFGPYGPPPGGRSKLPWAIGGGVVVAAAVVLILVFALGGESGSSKKDSPERAVGTYANAAVHNDRDTAKKVSCAADQSSFDDDSSGAPDVKSYKVGDAKVDGDHATVPITVVNKEGKSEDEVVPVHKEKGTWLVCFSDQGTSGGEGNSSGAGAASASAIPSGVRPSGIPSGTFCVTPDGSTPICASN